MTVGAVPTAPPPLLAVEEPPEELEPEAEAAPEAPSSTPPAWAKVPQWGKGEGFPAGRDLYFVPLEVAKMARKEGGEPCVLKDGSTRVCRQVILWELSLGDRKTAFRRAGGDSNRAADELCLQMIRAVDGHAVVWGSEMSPHHPRRIWADMGPKYREVLARMYTVLHVMSPEDVADFFGNCVELRRASS